MTICFFGIYDPAYARNRVLMQGLRAQGVEVIEARVDPSQHRGLSKYIALVRVARAAKRMPIDFVVVAFPGHTVVWLAKLLFRQPFVFDAFLSLYDSNVWDRKTHGPHSLAAALDWFLDWLGCMLADRVLLDTDAHIDYFVRLFHVRREKCIRVWIGADPELFYPREFIRPPVFTVHFHGSFIPLQGIEYILDAAKLLAGEAVQFRIVGSGQEYQYIVKKAEEMGLTKVEFVGKIPAERVPEYIASADLSLGIFGNTEKTLRVIPNKVFECIAMEKAVITADSPAMREIFTDTANVLLCATASGDALAVAIRRLMDDASLRERIAAGGRALFQAEFTPRRIAAELLSQLL